MQRIRKAYQAYYRAARGTVLGFFVMTILQKTLSVLMPDNTRALIDSAVYGGEAGAFGTIAVRELLLTAGFMVFLCIRYYLQNKIEIDATAFQRERVLLQVSKLDDTQMRSKPIGYYLQLVNGDIDTSKGLVATDLCIFITNIFFAIAMIGYMLSVDAGLTLIFFVVIPLFAIITKIMIPKLEAANKRLIEASETINNTVDDVIGGAQTIKLANAYAFMAKRINAFFAHYTDLKMKYMRLDLLYDFVLVTGLLNFGNILIYCIGGYMVIRGRVTIGTITIFAVYFSNLWNCAESFMAFFKEYKMKLISIDRINDFFAMKLEQEAPAEAALPPFEELRLQNVSFSYEHAEAATLQHCHLQIQRGDKLLIIGDNGSGKSTLARLLVKLLRADAGEITYNGVSYEEIPPSEIRGKICLLTAEPFVFAGDLQTNLFGANGQLSLLKDVGIYDDIQKGGGNLSSGQKKTLQMSRGLASPCDVYVFDEPLSFIDAHTKQEMIAFIETEFADKTVIVISHDPAVWRFCDKVYRIENGGIVRER
ncbi:MAG: ABC transporter ATP-binding protein/permease [Oscillospiraceae bacterium]|nr:ABC transporter ATP-binding protein/permease [Oscillospiraceae bacterium]